LQRLGRQLGGSARERRAAAPAFLQVQQQGKRNTASNVQALRADRRQLLHVRTLDGESFGEEEKKLIDLIKGRRERLKQLEVDLQQQQLVLADKLRQSAETNRTRSMAARVVERDREVLRTTTDVCKLEGDFGKAMIDLRAQAINLVKMPGKLLYSMDAAMFLSKDLKDLQAAPPAAVNFVQLGSTLKASSGLQLGEAVQEALQAAAGASDEGSQETMSSSSSRTGSHLAQAGTAGEHSAGPFDNVERMLRTLLANLNDQGNSDTTLNQWCLESKEENDKTRMGVKTSQDQASTQILWAQAAISTLEEQIGFFGSEITRLEGRADEIKQRATSEAATLGQQLADHRAAKEILDQVVDVLKGECDIDESELAVLVQTSHTHRQQKKVSLHSGEKNKLRTKHGQCTEAVKLIMQGKQKLVELDQKISTFQGEHTRVTGEEESSARGAAQQRGRDQSAAEAAKASRARDLETAKGEKRRKEEEMVLVEEAAKAIDKKCIVRESHADRIARRQDEIDALKNAYDVLNGETIPVESSLISVAGQ